MTLRDEIDALPEKPKDPTGNGDPGVWLFYRQAWEEYNRAHLAMAERLLRAYESACDHGCHREILEIVAEDTRYYFAKREAE